MGTKAELFVLVLGCKGSMSPHLTPAAAPSPRGWGWGSCGNLWGLQAKVLGLENPGRGESRKERTTPGENYTCNRKESSLLSTVQSELRSHPHKAPGTQKNVVC